MDKATRVVVFFLSVLALLEPIDSMTSTLSFARNLMSFWNVPQTGSLNVALYLRVLYRVGVCFCVVAGRVLPGASS